MCMQIFYKIDATHLNLVSCPGCLDIPTLTYTDRPSNTRRRRSWSTYRRRLHLGIQRFAACWVYAFCRVIKQLKVPSEKASLYIICSKTRAASRAEQVANFFIF